MIDQTKVKRELISIITPMFNEIETIENYRKAITSHIDRLSSDYDYDFEIVITDNCSTDLTFERALAWASEDSRVRAFKFSRNFGYQRSIFTGFLQSRGDAAIELDADLQDPVELLEVFLQKRREGFKIVYGVRMHRQEGWFITELRKIYYRTLRAISEDDLPVDAGDFMLIDRVVLDQLKLVYDPQIYIRGLVFGLGFRRIGIPYRRSSRQAGQSKFPFKKLAALAIDGIVGQSVIPLRLASFSGLFMAFATFILSLVYIALRLMNLVILPLGFTTTVVLILLCASMNALFLGIMGEYLARIYQLLRRKPLTVIEERSPETVRLR